MPQAKPPAPHAPREARASRTKGVQFSAQVQFTATVINDPQNRGVTWTISGASCAGASNPCGTVSPSNTPSGQPTTYTAPSNAPATNSVTVTATSVSDPSRFDQVTFTPGSDVQQGFVEPRATGPFEDSTIAGKWAASTGAPAVPSVHNSSGAFTLDGTMAFSGTIDETLFSSPFEIPDEAITGSYATTAVGRASVTLTSGGGGNGVIWIVSANRFVLLVSTNTGDKKPSATIFDRQ